jgi:hypothetical protein
VTGSRLADATPTPCPRCHRPQTAWAWGRPVCVRCHGDTVRLSHGREAARARHAATLRRIAGTAGNGPIPAPAPPPPRVAIVRRGDPRPAPPSPDIPGDRPPGVPTLRQRLKARREAERTTEEAAP